MAEPRFPASPGLVEAAQRDANTNDDGGAGETPTVPTVREIDPLVGRARRNGGPRILRAGSVQWEPDLTAKLRIECAKEDLTRRAVHNVLLRYFLTDAPKDVRRQLLAEMKTWERQQKGMAEP